jgi:hypothetical protein
MLIHSLNLTSLVYLSNFEKLLATADLVKEAIWRRKYFVGP